MAAVTALIAATSQDLNPAALRQRAHVAIDLARAARRLPGVSDQPDSEDGTGGLDIAAVLDAVERLPERRLGAADADIFRAVVNSMTHLAAATRQVVGTATANLDGLRTQVQDASVLAGAAQALLPQTGPKQAGLTARLDQASGELRQHRPGWWPAAGGQLTTVAELQMVKQALDGSAHSLIEAAQITVIEVAADVVTAANEMLHERAHAVIALADAAQVLLPHTSGQQAILTAMLADATAGGHSLEGQEPRPGTLAGLEAAGRDLEQLAAVDVDVLRVIAQATDGLRERVADAPALARSARALLDDVDTHDLRRRLPTLNDDLDEATLPLPDDLPARAPSTLAQVEAAADALARVISVEKASEELFFEAAVRLEKVRRRNIRVTLKAAAARSLLQYRGPLQDELATRLDTAFRAVPEGPMLAGRAWLPVPGPDRITRADLEAARQTLAGRLTNSLTPPRPWISPPSQRSLPCPPGGACGKPWRLKRRRKRAGNSRRQASSRMKCATRWPSRLRRWTRQGRRSRPGGTPWVRSLPGRRLTPGSYP